MEHPDTDPDLEMEEIQLQFFNFTVSQFKRQYEVMLRTKIKSLIENLIQNIVRASEGSDSDGRQVKLEMHKTKVIDELFNSLKMFHNSMENKFNECFFVPDNIVNPELINDGIYSTEDLAYAKSKYEETLQAFLRNEVMINALKAEK